LIWKSKIFFYIQGSHIPHIIDFIFSAETSSAFFFAFLLDCIVASASFHFLEISINSSGNSIETKSIQAVIVTTTQSTSALI
jgi:hypothetical protein